MTGHRIGVPKKLNSYCVYELNAGNTEIAL